jgi:hypothetical protein
MIWRFRLFYSSTQTLLDNSHPPRVLEHKKINYTYIESQRMSTRLMKVVDPPLSTVMYTRKLDSFTACSLTHRENCCTDRCEDCGSPEFELRDNNPCIVSTYTRYAHTHELRVTGIEFIGWLNLTLENRSGHTFWYLVLAAKILLQLVQGITNHGGLQNCKQPNSTVLEIADIFTITCHKARM